MYMCTLTALIFNAVPDVPAFISVSRLNGSSAMIRWIPLTQTEVERFLIIELEIAYEPIIDSVTNCSSYNFTDSETVLIRENLLQQSTASITGLEPNREYCIAIQVGTSDGGESGFQNAVKIPCKAIMCGSSSSTEATLQNQKLFLGMNLIEFASITGAGAMLVFVIALVVILALCCACKRKAKSYNIR